MAKIDSSGDNRRPSMFQRLTEEAIGKRRPLGSPEDPARERWPNIWEWLSVTDIDEYRAKEPATITIRLADGGAVATISDRAYGSSVDVSTPNLADLLDCLEKALTDPGTVVRRNHHKDPKIRKRKSGN